MLWSTDSATLEQLNGAIPHLTSTVCGRDGPPKTVFGVIIFYTSTDDVERGRPCALGDFPGPIRVASWYNRASEIVYCVGDAPPEHWPVMLSRMGQDWESLIFPASKPAIGHPRPAELPR